jgi:ABC-type sugar transport system substrate-binding protein
MALGVINVLEQQKKAGIIKVVGFDNDASMQPYLKSGVLLSTVDAFGKRMAVDGIQVALKILHGMDNTGSYSTDFKIIKG